MGREGGIDGRNHVVLVLLIRVFVGHGIRIAGLHTAHVCLHSKQRAVHRQLLVVWDVHAAKVSTGVSAVHDMAIGEDMGECAFLAELAVSLCKILAGRSLSQWLIGVQEWTSLPGLTCALSVELAGHV
jgi:hypothetical protein